jgi:hypothetical protein
MSVVITVLILLALVGTPCMARVPHNTKELSPVIGLENDSVKSVAFAPDGSIHMAYYDEDRKEIVHIWGSDAHWDREDVGPSDGTKTVSIAVDHDGIPWICYGDGYHFGNLLLAHKVGSTWTSTLIANGGYPLVGTGLGGTLGFFIGAAVAYAAGPVGWAAVIKLATAGAAAGGATGAVVGEYCGDAGQYSSMAIDQWGNVCIVYNGGQHFASLYYAVYVPSPNVVLTSCVDSGSSTFSDTGYAPSLKLDAQDHPHIAYLDGKHFPSLRYTTTVDGKSWTAMTVDNGGNSFASVSAPSLALDSYGNPHISYYVDSPPELRLASFNGKSWSHSAVGDAPIIGGKTPTTLLIDSKDAVYIFYFNKWNPQGYVFHRVYHTANNPTWDFMGFTRGGHFGTIQPHTALTIDPDDHIAFIYRDTNDSILWYQLFIEPLSPSFLVNCSLHTHASGRNAGNHGAQA